MSRSHNQELGRAQNKHDSEKKKKDAAHDDIDDWELPHVDEKYFKGIADTMGCLQREGSLLQGEHNLLGEAFLADTMGYLVKYVAKILQ
ncbi:hypothetical protein JHK86_042486 [Glycine max]|nr:hypothetical protein JHK86_042486 [Glycine max]